MTLPTRQAIGKTREKIFSTLQAGRGIAALLVLLYHAEKYIFTLPKYWGQDPLGQFFYFGHAGVAFFFVLSGFIILHVHWNDLNQPSRLSSYAGKRFLRIYPIYWLVLIVILAVFFLNHAFGQGYEREPSVILSSFTLLPFTPERKTVLTVAWTLYHEILFYTVFALMILHRRVGIFVLIGWFTASAVSLMFPALPFPLSFLLSPLHLLFAMGMIACILFRREKIMAPGALAIIGIVLFFALGLEEDYLSWLSFYWFDLFTGFASMLAVMGVLELEKRGQLRVPDALRLTGDASYVIYLTHFFLLSLLAKIFFLAGAGKFLPIHIAFILLVLLTSGIGIGIHLWIERPLLLILRSKVPR